MPKRKKSKSTEGLMDFEMMLRQYLGDLAYNEQDTRYDLKMMISQMKKVIKVIEKNIYEIESTTRHKERMLNDIERLKKDLSEKDTDPWTIVIHLFSLVSRLFGYDYIKGVLINTPFYHQTEDQYYAQLKLEGGEVMQRYNDYKNLIELQRDTYKKLKEDGHSDFRIAQIMNTTVYKIMKMKKNL